MANSPHPTVREVREELDRLLEGTAFRREPSHSRLLRYPVEQNAAGVRFRVAVDEVLVVDLAQPVQGERWSGAVAQ